jgi:hypothetical protein
MRQTLIALFLIGGLTILAGCAAPMVPMVEEEANNGYYSAGRIFLVGNEREEAGYGLYSYFLFGSPPTNQANRNLYLRAISICLKTVPDVKSREDVGFHRSELNATYIPITQPVPKKFSNTREPSRGATEKLLNELSEWTLEHYNYNRAQFLLRSLAERRVGGPYIISLRKPLSDNKRIAGNYLRQDLSVLPPNRTDLIETWVQEFVERANQPNRWDSNTMEELALKLRVAIAFAAEALPRIQDALKVAITWTPWTKE